MTFIGTSAHLNKYIYAIVIRISTVNVFRCCVIKLIIQNRYDWIINADEVYFKNNIETRNNIIRKLRSQQLKQLNIIQPVAGKITCVHLGPNGGFSKIKVNKFAERKSPTRLFCEEANPDKRAITLFHLLWRSEPIA